MHDELPFPKTPMKGELLCQLFSRYPSIDVTTIQVVSHIQSIGKKLSLMINNDLVEYGLTEGKLYVLAYLFTEELMGNEDPSPSDIAGHVGVTRGTVTGLLDGLERDGFLERSHDLRDRRGLTIRITDKARSFLDMFLPKSIMKLGEVLPLTAEEKDNLIETLGRVEVALGETTQNFPQD